MNSLGVNPFVYHLYNDLNNGLILFQVYIILIFLVYLFTYFFLTYWNIKMVEEISGKKRLTQ